MSARSRSFVVAAVALFAGSLAIGGWVWPDKSLSEQQHPTVQQIVEAVKPILSDEQAVALADGVLTREEYEVARGRVVACLESHGLTVHREPGQGPGGIDEIWTESSGSAGSPKDKVLGCYERHQGKLSIVWAEQNRPTADQLAARERAVDSCMLSNGFEAKPLSEFWGRDSEQSSAYMRCLGEVGAPGP